MWGVGVSLGVSRVCTMSPQNTAPERNTFSAPGGANDPARPPAARPARKVIPANGSECRSCFHERSNK